MDLLNDEHSSETVSVSHLTNQMPPSPQNSSGVVGAVYLSAAILGEDIYDDICLVLGGFVTVFIAAVGIPGNVLSCLVFWRQGLQCRMNLSLLCLSLVDLCFAAGSLAFGCLILLIYFGEPGLGEQLYLQALQSSTGVMCALKEASACFNMVITVERCVCVMRPLKAASLMRTKTMAIILGALALTVQVGYLPLAFKYEVKQIKLNGVTRWQLGLSETGIKYRHVIDTIVISIMGTAIPIVTVAVVAVATAITLFKLRAVMKWRKTVGSTSLEKEHQQTALARMFVGVSVKHVIVAMPFMATILTHLAVPEFSTSYRFAYLSTTCTIITSVFSLIDCCVNIFIYFARSSRFNMEIRRMGSRSIKESIASTMSVLVTDY